MNRDGVKINIILPILVTTCWLILYFTVIWRLPFIWNLNRVKIPDDCKEVMTNAVWSDVEIMHIRAERAFHSKKSREQLQDYIDKYNRHLGRIEFGWWSYPEYDHVDAISPDDYPELWDEDCYVLSYSTWGTSIDIFVFLFGGVSAVLMGLLVFFLSVRSHLKNMEMAVFSLGYVIGWCNLWITLFLGVFTYLHFGLVVAGLLIALTALGVLLGVNGKNKERYRIATAGVCCSLLGLCITFGGFLVHLLIVCG